MFGSENIKRYEICANERLFDFVGMGVFSIKRRMHANIKTHSFKVRLLLVLV